MTANGKHVVFGKVVEGIDVVKKVESYGSRSGRISAKIVVTGSGQLAPLLATSRSL